MRTKRFLMNKEDGSPGGGAAPPAAPAEPPASNGAPAPAEPAVPVSQLKAVIGEVFGELRNGLFADLRKAGALGKEKSTEVAPPAPTQPQQQSTPAAAPASTGLSATDVQSMLVQERVFARAEAEHKLTDTQSEFMRSALRGVPAAELAVKANAFLRSMGIVKGASEPETAAPAATAATPQAPPISDKGSPAPGGATSWERELAERPMSMSAAARAAMDAHLGVEKARRMRVEAAQRVNGSTRVVATPQR